MEFNFKLVDAHTASLQTIHKGMLANLDHLQQLKNSLEAEFSGAGATGYSDLMKQFQGKIDEYNATVGRIQGAIDETAGGQGFMAITDSDAGKGFAGIQV